MITSGEGLPMKEGPTDLFVQFVDDQGQVVGAGTAAAGRPALADVRTAGRGHRHAAPIRCSASSACCRRPCRTTRG